MSGKDSGKTIVTDVDKVDTEMIRKFYEIFYYTTQGLLKKLAELTKLPPGDVMVYRLKMRENGTNKELTYEIYLDAKTGNVVVCDKFANYTDNKS